MVVSLALVGAFVLGMFFPLICYAIRGWLRSRSEPEKELYEEM